MLASNIGSKNSLFDSEVARQYPPEDWLTLRIPGTCCDLITALKESMSKSGQSFARASGPLIQIFFIKRDEIVSILNAPSMANREGLYALLDRYSLASNETIYHSFCTAGISSELDPRNIQEEIQFVRGSLPYGPSDTTETIEKHIARCLPDKQVFLRPFAAHIRTRLEVDAIWSNRSNILMRHIRRDTVRQICDAGKTHLNVAGFELEMFDDTCRAIVFTLVQEAYWPTPDEMQADLDRMRADPDVDTIGWTLFPLIAFPDAITVAMSLEDELRLAGSEGT